MKTPFESFTSPFIVLPALLFIYLFSSPFLVKLYNLMPSHVLGESISFFYKPLIFVYDNVPFYRHIIDFEATFIKMDAPAVTSSHPVTHPVPKAADTYTPIYASKVPGKAGFVSSPYTAVTDYIDVRGYAKNAKLKDPYSGKIFLVPE